MKPKCEMTASCPNAVTHIGEKGFIYCKDCIVYRRGIERCRRMRPFELRLIEAGSALPFYTPRGKAETLRVLEARRKA